MRRFFGSLLEVVEVAIIALGAVFLIRTFLVQPFLVSGASMVPNFHNGDYLLIDEVSYRFREPERGEVVVFRYPNDESTFFIKRIIGLPGERVALNEGKITVFNAEHPQGELLGEEYLPSTAFTSARSGNKWEYLVLGDNRSYSYDSRDWGALKRKEIIGLVRLRLWPVTGLTVFAAPSY